WAARSPGNPLPGSCAMPPSKDRPARASSMALHDCGRTVDTCLRTALGVWMATAVALAAAQGAPGAPGARPGAKEARAAESAGPERSVREWLVRMHEASRLRSYAG